MATNSADCREVVLKMDEKDDPAARSFQPTNAEKIWRDSSYDFWKDKEEYKQILENGTEDFGFDFSQNNFPDARDNAASSSSMEDPPSKLIGQFLHKQEASGDFCLDMDLEMAELQNDGVVFHRSLTTVSESPTSMNRVTFDPNPPGSGEAVSRRHQNKDSPSKNSTGSASCGGVDGEILKCSSRNDGMFSNSASFKRKSHLLKERTKSRLMDPPPQPPEKSERVVGRSGQSGFTGKDSVIDDEEDDSLLEEDLPEEYKKDKLDIWILLEWVSLILIIAALVCTLVIPYWRKKNLWKLRLWKWEVLVLVLICGRLVSGWAIRIIVFFLERNFLLRKRVLYFVYGIKKAVQNCLWLGLVLIAWHCLFDKKVERKTRSRILRYVTKVLVCLVVGTLLWLVKTLVVKVLASCFHVSTYFDRIQESLFNQYVIEALSGPPLIEIKRNEDEEERIAVEILKLQNAGAALPASLKASTYPSPLRGKIISGRIQRSPRLSSPRLSHALSEKANEENDGITIDHLHKLNPKNVSAWNMKRLMNIIRYGTLSTLDEQIRDTSHDDDESATKIRSECEAKAAARKIFQNVARTGSRYIYLEDIMRFMQEEEALKVMSLFEGTSESKKISKSCLKKWVRTESTGFDIG
ncbi:hypothetical protein MANES_03G085500v8 [Manihot esculenta]|uniref:Uncharacterized protein n=1 Tax=Manihot esculenta TaxID=3983 RepID=A0ACB7HZA7_MANES|nr:hypothetical protein MANES_03G085500v8 [Manihot esculenta]